MVSDPSDLPFFPKFETEMKIEDKILIIWFEPHFSQSHYNIKNCTSGSNACTLIAVLMASKCHHNKIQVNHPKKPLNYDLVHLFAISMLEGNKIHDHLKINNMLKHINLTVPEAIEFADKFTEGMTEWKSLVYMEPLSTSLYENIRPVYGEWIKQQKTRRSNNLYIILIADSRTVLFILQEDTDTVTIMDSHQHSASRGSFIGICRTNRLKSLCDWFSHTNIKSFKCDPKLYELSFLYFKRKQRKSKSY
ncbi:unnamed protein product [Brassicogethes aeneus]|uniref:Uncharacterized protein n=1 Tax=Brassicogethes aeneus TaxID=1431903 RepID=A0A9P0FHE1_BRAAE|nr:unnamed protein product [Brassicogethes aeneus]